MVLKYLLVLTIWLAFPAFAQEGGDDINVVIFAPKDKDTAMEYQLPSCNESHMLDAVVARVREYQQDNPASSIVNRRKQALVVKNLREFNEIPIKDFDNSSNYEVARELIMTKVNYHISEENIRLCRGNKGSNIYLLIYPEGYGFRVQILNFVAASDSGNDFSVFYAPQPELKSVSPQPEATAEIVDDSQTATEPSGE